MNHHVRTKLDELKRTELRRLRDFARQLHDQDGGKYSAFGHIDHDNPNTFEIQDLKKLIRKVSYSLRKFASTLPFHTVFQEWAFYRQRRTWKRPIEGGKKSSRRTRWKNISNANRGWRIWPKRNVKSSYSTKKKLNDRKKLLPNEFVHPFAILRTFTPIVLNVWIDSLPQVHHPGSKQQFEEVWENQDHMNKDEFNPRTFFVMHGMYSDDIILIYTNPSKV